MTPADVEDFVRELVDLCHARGVHIEGQDHWLRLHGPGGELLATEGHIERAGDGPWVMTYRLGHGVDHG